MARVHRGCHVLPLHRICLPATIHLRGPDQHHHPCSAHDSPHAHGATCAPCGPWLQLGAPRHGLWPNHLQCPRKHMCSLAPLPDSTPPSPSRRCSCACAPHRPSTEPSVLRGGVKLDFRIKNNAGRPVRQQASRQVTGNPVTSQPDSKQTVNMPTCPCEQQIRVLRCCENRNQNQSSVFHCVTSNRVLSARYSLGAIDSALGSDCTLSLPVLWRGLKIEYRIYN